MLADQPTAAAASRQASHRWAHADIVEALDNFAKGEGPSQRAYAKQHDIPHATFDCWQRHYSAAAADPIDSFFRSGPGVLVLRRIVTSALLNFQQRGACGIRLVSTFLQQTQLDRYV